MLVEMIVVQVKIADERYYIDALSFLSHSLQLFLRSLFSAAYLLCHL